MAEVCTLKCIRQTWLCAKLSGSNQYLWSCANDSELYVEKWDQNTKSGPPWVMRNSCTQWVTGNDVIEWSSTSDNSWLQDGSHILVEDGYQLLLNWGPILHPGIVDQPTVVICGCGNHFRGPIVCRDFW